MKIIRFTIYLLAFLISGFCFASQASAVTEFKATVKPSGGDYSTLATAENGLDYTGTCDLTSSSYLTAGYDGAVGDPTLITDAEAVTWDGGASTGNMVHITTVAKSGADRFFINVTAGSLADDDVIDDGDGNTVTVNGTPDTAQISIEIDGDWTGVTDTTAVTIDGWTTDATHYIKIYTTTAARHDGKWNEGKYRLELTPGGGYAIIESKEPYTRIDGLQIQNTASSLATAINITGTDNTGTKVSNCIVKSGIATGGNSFGIRFRGALASSGTVYLWNNIIYDFNISSDRGIIIYDANVTAYVYNNTVQNCDVGFRAAEGTFVAKNNISYNNTDNYNGTFNASSTNNLSGPTQTDAPGSNARNAATVTFADEANDDFHLALSDLGARGYGLSQYADANLPVIDDIDGNNRRPNGEPTDIGADEDIDTLDAESVRISNIQQSGTRYTTLSAWEADRDGDITGYYPEVAQIDGAWSISDTTAVTITDWTTDATHYIKIYTTAAARHDGKWNTGRYRLEAAVTSFFLTIVEENVQIDGLQIYNTRVNNDSTAIGVSATGVLNIRFSNNLIKLSAPTDAFAHNGITINAGAATSIAYVYNNIIYDIGTGASCRGIRLNNTNVTLYAYNNTVYNNYYGLIQANGTFVAKNNLSYNNTDNYYGTFSASSTNNLSGPSSDAQCPATNARNGYAVTFVDAANKNFHLASNDGGARNYGTNLLADGYIPFSTDIDGEDRPGESVWDIGADELAKYTIEKIKGDVKLKGDVKFK